MARYIIDVARSESNDGDHKPKLDVSRILHNQLGFTTIYLKKYQHSKIDQHFLIDHRIHAKLAGLKLNSNDVVLVNYPLYSGAKFSTHLLNYLKEHRVRTIALIHDLDSLRFAWSIFGTLEQEAAYLNQYDYVITHNQRMTAKLQSVGLTTETVELELFDYLSNAKSQTNSESYKNNLTFAGNLNKATFLQDFQVHAPLHVDLYGKTNNPQQLEASLDYHGSCSPEELASKMGHGFGLVWDGKQTSEISGLFGNYLKYNNPYKVSSYFSAGMPVIVWEQAAICEFVRKNNVGISVAGLGQLQEKVAQITSSQFTDMLRNVKHIKQKINAGEYITTAVSKCME